MPELSPFARQRKENNGFHRLCPTDVDQQTTFSRWKGLRSINLQQLAPLVDVEDNRMIALKFKGKDAALVVNTLDKALKQVGGPEETRLNALKVLRKLAANTLQVPESYLVGRWTWFTVQEEIIASGGFADIREGRLGRKNVAVKTIRISQQTNISQIHRAFCKESVLWMNVSHPNILKLIAVEIKPLAMKFSMISEMMTNGNIINYIRTREANRLSLLKDVASGLKYLHERVGIVHGDLKGHNVLIDNQTPPQACISDFGLSAIAPWMPFNPTTTDAGGTPGFTAPELYLEGAKPTKEADIYAFGMVVYEVVTGSHPFMQHRAAGLPMLTASGSRPEKPEDPVARGFGQGTWEFIETCWNEDPEQRPAARNALGHFERVAQTSTVVDPSPFRWTRNVGVEASSKPANDSMGHSQLFSQQSLNSSSRLRQASFAAHTFINPQIVRSPVLIPPTNDDRPNKPNLLDRVRRRIMALKLLPSPVRDAT